MQFKLVFFKRFLTWVGYIMFLVRLCFLGYFHLRRIFSKQKKLNDPRNQFMGLNSQKQANKKVSMMCINLIIVSEKIKL